MVFHRMGVQVKKVEGFKVSTTSDGKQEVSFQVPQKEADRILELIKAGHHLFTCAVWTCPDLHKGC